MKWKSSASLPRLNHMQHMPPSPMGCGTIYLLRVTDWEKNHLDGILESLEKAIQSRFILALTGQLPPGEHTRELLALSARLGGLGLLNPLATAPEQRAASQQISRRPNHQSRPLTRWLSCSSAQLGDKNSTK